MHGERERRVSAQYTDRNDGHAMGVHVPADFFQLPRVEVDHLHTNVRADYFLVLKQLIDDLRRRIHWDRKRNTNAPVDFHGVDTDDLSVQVHERTTRVARVDSGIRLDELASFLRIPQLAAMSCHSADDASTDAMLERERAAKSTHPFTCSHISRSSELDRWPFPRFFGFDLQKSDI